jgi:hypothetical protein
MEMEEVARGHGVVQLARLLFFVLRDLGHIFVSDLHRSGSHEQPVLLGILVPHPLRCRDCGLDGIILLWNISQSFYVIKFH